MKKLTISKIIKVGGRDAIIAAERNFTMSDINEIPATDSFSKAYYFLLTDPHTKLNVPVTWTKNDEKKPVEEQIKIAASLMRNAIDCLVHLIEMKEEEERAKHRR